MAQHTENPETRPERINRETASGPSRISSLPRPRDQSMPATRYVLSRTRTVQRGAIISPPTTMSNRGPAYSSVKAVGTYVPRLTQKSFEKYGFASAALATDWSTIVGPELARDTRPDRLKWPRAPAQTQNDSDRTGAILVIRVDPSRALEISYKERQIIERINSYFGYRTVTGLRIVQAPIAAPGATSSTTAPSKTASAPSAKRRGEAAPAGGLGLALAQLESSVLSGAERAG